MPINDNKKLDQIINDKKSGSSRILSNLQNILLNNIDDRDFLNTFIQVIDKHLSHFASIKNFSSELKKILKKKDTELLRSFIKQSILKQQSWIEALYKANKKLFKKYHSITTISHSNTLVTLFKFWKSDFDKLNVFILESRPRLEGRKTVKELVKTGIKCTLISDAMMAYAVKESDVILIGADQVLRNGNVVNKSGSLPLALCAKEFNKPFYVIASKEKSINSNKYLPSPSPVNEVWRASNTKVKIKNYYFEEIPSHLITKILR